VTGAVRRDPRRAGCHVQPRWSVCPAGDHDMAAVAVAVRHLLVELGGKPPSARAIEAAAGAILADPDSGTLLLAVSTGHTIGFLGASWQSAVRVPGRYAQIQELWVHLAWRSEAVGAGLLAALYVAAAAQGIERVEVGLPGPDFSGLAATESFYLHNGFTSTGTRMRRLLG
jgi:GNAT superfamily N-acetyltransferase